MPQARTSWHNQDKVLSKKTSMKNHRKTDIFHACFLQNFIPALAILIVIILILHIK